MKTAQATQESASQTHFTSDTIKQQEERLISVLAGIGDSWDVAKKVLHWIQSRHVLPQPKPDNWRQVIIRGETDGTMGMDTVKELLAWNHQATLILSGGVYGREKSIGDIGAIDLYRQLEHDLTLLGYPAEEIKSHVFIDSFSQHTIDQGIILSGLLKSLHVEDVFVVMPLYHMPRFLLTIAANLKQQAYRPNIVPLAYGDWHTRHPRKTPLKASATKPTPYSYADLFALPLTPSSVAGKFDCGEVDKIATAVSNKKALTFTGFSQWYEL